MIGIERRVEEPARPRPREPEHLSTPLHAAYRGGRYASLAQFYKTRDPTRRQ
jgi:hypothetical protein